MLCNPKSFTPIRLTLIWSLVAVVCFNYGCNRPSASNPYPYTPDDFSEPIRGVLRKIEQYNVAYIINGGCRGSGEIYDSAEVYYDQLSKIASTEGLLKASQCSSPTIRASALSILMWDTTVNPAQLVREHMFDTAQVFDDYSQYKWTVISFVLHNSYRWPDKATWDSIRKELLQQNPFELAAFYLMDAETPVDTFPGYYQTVKKMARFVDSRSYSDNVNWFNGIGALTVLASYRYQEDIPLIDPLIESILFHGHGQFLPADAIRNFPAPAFEKYYLDTSIRWRSQFRFLRYEDFEKYYYRPDDGLGNFIALLLEHKSPKSALLLEKIWEAPPQLMYAKLNNREREYSVDYMKRHISLGIRRLYTSHYDRLIKITAAWYNVYVKENGEPLPPSTLDAGDSTPDWREERNLQNAKKGYFESYWWE